MHGWSMVAALAAAAGCGVQVDLGNVDTDELGATEGNDEAGASGDGPGATSMNDGMTDGEDGSDGNPPDDPTDPPPPPEGSDAVDILFVVDNSGFMGAEQAKLAQSIGELTEPLRNAGIRFRLGITTTDVGNPWCQGSTPEAGNFVLSSCRERQSDFVFDGAMQIDATQEACLDVCALDSFDIDPSTVDGQPAPAVRPWLEWTSAADNNTPGQAPSALLSCALPMGIAGCGFEQPLEAMHRAIQRSSTVGEEQNGFIRDDANLLVIFVTDEADCSYNPEQETIFLPDGDRVFWSDQDAPAPTSAVCWNAGVECTGAGADLECNPVDLAADGSPTTPDAAAMLPVSRYIDQLQAIQDAKIAGRVAVMGLVGRAIDGGFEYGNTGTPEFHHDFGVGPGCDFDDQRAVPPVRMRAVANAFASAPDDGLYSVCNGDYGPSLGAVAATIISWND
ncbi:MAG: hypothetical protein AAF799_10715 [Myxococcota bacterium]